MTTHKYMLVFSVRRDTWSGELELDGFLCTDAEDLHNKKVRWDAVNALEGVSPNRGSPTEAFDRAVRGMKIRAANDGAILGVYCVKTDTQHTRDTFEPVAANIGASSLMEYRI